MPLSRQPHGGRGWWGWRAEAARVDVSSELLPRRVCQEGWAASPLLKVGMRAHQFFFSFVSWWGVRPSEGAEYRTYHNENCFTAREPYFFRYVFLGVFNSCIFLDAGRKKKSSFVAWLVSHGLSHAVWPNTIASIGYLQYCTVCIYVFFVNLGVFLRGTGGVVHGAAMAWLLKLNLILGVQILNDCY